VSPLYFFLKDLATFFIVASSAVSPLFIFSWKTDDLFCAHHRHFYWFHSGVTPHLFYLSNLVSSLFFVNLPTIFSFGCHPWRVSPEAVPPFRLPKVIPLTRKRGNCECIATWGRSTPRRSFSSLITTHMSSLKSLNLSAAVYSIFTVDSISLRYAVTLT